QGVLGNGAKPWLKSGMKKGDIILMSRPLGVGVFFAAQMQNINLKDSSEEVMRNLVTSQQPLIEKIYLLQDKFGETFINAATDITGYGFIGHLKEMIDSSNLLRKDNKLKPIRVLLDLFAFKAYPGVFDLIHKGIKSSLFESNKEILDQIISEKRNDRIIAFSKRNKVNSDSFKEKISLLLDPQTCGPLLISCAPKYEKFLKDEWYKVGDADQSIYSFRAADFRILIGFQEDFKNSSNNDQKASLVKLEENYRSSANILTAANSLIENNTERIDKVLRSTREKGELLKLLSCDDEISEAEAITTKLRSLNNYNNQPIWKNFAILYRTRAQSRVLEESLVRWRIPYTIFGGLRFYDRREVKDAVAYLKVLVNSSDNVSLLRIINVPRRGIGKTTIQKLNELSNKLNIPLWEVINDKQSLDETIGRSSKGINKFTELMNDLLCYIENSGPAQILQLILEKSGYLSDLLTSGSEESEDRRNNLQELINAATQFEEETENPDVEGFLSTAALTTDNDTKKNHPNSVTLMTLHNSKGLEFQNVFITGLEQGLFPSHRSIDTPSLLEEERRLCYVGITRAKERVFLSHARERRLWGGMREATIPSIFLSEIPEELIDGELPQSGGASIRRDHHLDRLTRVDRKDSNEFINRPINAVRKLYSGPSKGKSWLIGDKVIHSKFGKGEIIHIFGSGEKISIAVKFGDKGSKILDPRLAPIRAIN
ncbi:ATP-binding domain-containing protein, partial [Prochlorococcus sp. AH-716-F13]|nr:ATP-binding domain-containing protein [Prochlorococcus sp. AH-716-F13]